MSKTNLQKSIDEMIDEVFAKSDAPNLDVAQEASTTADAVMAQVPSSEDDASRGAGRPAQISDVPKIDTDGKRAGKYDNDITSNSPEAGQENPEGKKQADDKRSDQTMDGKGEEKPAGAPFEKSAEYQEFLEFKKAKAARKEEKKLQKTMEAHADLIKSAVREATSGIVRENSELRKSLAETQELVKAMAERPQRRKSIDGLQALEKSHSEEQAPASFSKSEMLDVAEELVMKKAQGFGVDHLIELENTGFVFDKAARAILENAIKSKK